MNIKDSSRLTYGVPLTSRIWRDSNGQLICRDCIIARTGSYDYLESEIIEGGDKNKIVKVFRTDDEVFDPTSIASFENKPFVDDHPQENVSLDNYKELSKGYMINVRRGTDDLENCLICDIVVTDSDTIDEIVSGRKRELSLGYDTVIVNRGGNYYMTDIRGNHLALVDDGRAGCATIRDSARQINRLGGIKMSKSKVRLFDEDIYEVEELPEDEVITEEIPQNSAEEQHDEDPVIGAINELKAMVIELKEMLTAKKDEDTVEEVKEEVKTEEPVEDIVGDEDVVEEEAVVEEDCGDKLLDADEITEETVKANDSKSVYKQFTKLADGNITDSADAVNKSFQDRYNRAAKKN